MLSVMTWNVENLERPTPAADAAAHEAYAIKLRQIVEVIAEAGPDLIGVQEVLASPQNLAPEVFEDLRSELSKATGRPWNGCVSQRPDGRGIRVGWFARGRLSNPTNVAVYPHQVPPTTIDDDGTQITAITAAKRGALAVTYTRSDGLTVHAHTAHLKSKLLTFPGPVRNIRGSTPAMRPSAPASACTPSISGPPRPSPSGPGPPSSYTTWGRHRHVLVCGDLNDTPQAATTQILLGAPGSQLGTGGFAQPDAGDGNRLWNLAPAMPTGDPADRCRRRRTGRGSTTGSKS